MTEIEIALIKLNNTWGWNCFNNSMNKQRVKQILESALVRGHELICQISNSDMYEHN